jgi:hypothetical protein
MRIVEQFAKALASILTSRKAERYEEARKEIQTASRFYLKMDIEHLSLFNTDQLAAYFTDLNGKLEADLALFCADLLHETAYLADARGESAEALRLRKLSLHLYSLALQEDPKFQSPDLLEKARDLAESIGHS